MFVCFYLTDAVEGWGVYESLWVSACVCSYPAKAVEGSGVYYSGQMCDNSV